MKRVACVGRLRRKVAHQKSIAKFGDTASGKLASVLLVNWGPLNSMRNDAPRQVIADDRLANDRRHSSPVVDRRESSLSEDWPW